MSEKKISVDLEVEALLTKGRVRWGLSPTLYSAQALCSQGSTFRASVSDHGPLLLRIPYLFFLSNRNDRITCRFLKWGPFLSLSPPPPKLTRYSPDPRVSRETYSYGSANGWLNVFSCLIYYSSLKVDVFNALKRGETGSGNPRQLCHKCRYFGGGCQ